MQIYKYVIKISKFAVMKKITALFLLIIVAFSSCETDLDINTDWEEVTVVFGLLDQSQEKQYIRINKAFLGDENAYVMASVADSLNFNPENLEVKIERVSPTGNILATKILTDTLMLKDSGMFASDNNIIYTFDTDDFLIENKNYVLSIKNLKNGNVVSANTDLIHELQLMDYFNNPIYKLGFYSDISKVFTNMSITWDHSKNAEIYQMSMIVNYSEYGSEGSIVEKSIQKVFPLIDYDGVDEIEQIISGEMFFDFIANNIEPSTTVNRKINDVDLLFTAGAGDLYTYMNMNEPPTGIVQERPIHSYITNGYGLFSCRLNKSQDSIFITEDTKKAIADSLQHLNFIYP